MSFKKPDGYKNINHSSIKDGSIDDIQNIQNIQNIYHCPVKNIQFENEDTNCILSSKINKVSGH